MYREKVFKVIQSHYSELIVKEDIKEILNAIDTAKTEDELVYNIIAIRDLEVPMLPPFPGNPKKFKQTQLYAYFLTKFTDHWICEQLVETELKLQIKELQAQYPNEVRVVETESDVGATKVGNDDFAFEISNGFGDGLTVNIIIDKKIEFGEKNLINEDFLDMQGCLVARNNTHIYDYDCGAHITEENLKGRYIVYSGYGFVVFQKLSDE